MCIEYEGDNVLVCVCVCVCVLDGLNIHYSNVDRRCCFRAEIVHEMVFT